MSLSVGFIGVRDGETLISSTRGNQCKGTIMKIRGFYPPVNSFLVNLTDEDIRDKLNNYAFFHNKSTEERRDWLNSNVSPYKDPYLSDMNDFYVKFNAIGGTFIMKNLSTEIIDSLLKGNPKDSEGYWSIKDVYNMFPRKPGSKAARHTLIFRPGNWDVVPDNNIANKNYIGVGINMINGIIEHIDSNKIPKTHSVYVVPIAESLKQTNPGVNEIGIFYQTEGINKLDFDNLLPICASLELDIGEMRTIRDLIKWFNPSAHKSLIQKILRTRCSQVEYSGKMYNGKETLITSFCMLLSHPGAFVPNIQRYVTGLESAAKRLAVSIAEDAYVENGTEILSLLCGSLVAQNIKTWRPSSDLIRSWINTGVKALDSPCMYSYDWHTAKKRITVWSPWFASYYILASIRSFQSDEDMLCSIAERNGIAADSYDIRELRIMPLVHCVDQHCFTDIAHFYPHDIVAKIGSYYNLFRHLWNDVTGINPRKSTHQNYDFVVGSSESADFFNKSRTAQNLLWISKMFTPIKSEIYMEETYKFTYKLSDGVLSSLISSHEIRVGDSTAILIVHPDDIYRYVAVKRPSRDKNTEPELTDNEKSTAIEAFTNLLKIGINFKHVPDTLPQFKGLGVRLIDDEYWIIGKTLTKWSEESNLEITLPLVPRPDISSQIKVIYTALTQTSDGVSDGADEVLDNYLRELPVDIIRRSMLYLGFGKEIELYHIGRDGSGVTYDVSPLDTGVNYLMAIIAVLYPAALVKSSTGYIVKNGPLMWSITKKIKFLNKVTNYPQWAVPSEEKRQLWEHQKDAIATLVRDRSNNKRTKIIWIPPGLGKTAIIVNYIASCISNSIMPKYCIYTLPPSAFNTVVRELGMRNIPYIHLDMRQSSKTPKNLIPGLVNIIYHDHLRMTEEVKILSSESLFIVDEFHKTMNETKRTSSALEIANSAADVIVMTGTLIKDTHVEKVIKWLEQSVDFEVTTKNYWVALSSIISRKIQTKIIVDRFVREVPFTDNERSEYLSVVPESLGGTAVKINFRKAVDISYEAISRDIVTMVLLHWKAGLGVFVVARNVSHQDYLYNKLSSNGITNIFLIGTGNSITLTPTYPPQGIPVPEVVITTPNHCEGYSLTRYNIMISGVYFTNQATREQLEARINRIDSISPSIRIILIHAGIISYIHRNYEKARNLSAALKGFAKDVDLNPSDITNI